MKKKECDECCLPALSNHRVHLETERAYASERGNGKK